VPLTRAGDPLKFMQAHLSPDFHDKQDRPMIDLHYWTTPNGHKITMFL
jgi:hypothetical protein